MKAWYKSKFFWFGALFVVNAFAKVFGFESFVPGADLSQYTSMAIGVAIWILRKYTTQPVNL